MTKRNFQSDLLVKPIMKIIFGLMCLLVSYTTISPLNILNKDYNHFGHSEPQAILGMNGWQWITLICGLILILLGIIGIVKIFK